MGTNETINPEQKLVVVVMGQDCERFLDTCLESIQGADVIVYCDGGSSDNSKEIAIKNNAEIIVQGFDKHDKTMNGRQRNFYLEYVNKHYPEYWCLAIDADEIVEDIGKVKEAINRLPEGLYSVHMEHFIGDLCHVDATQEKHYVPNRLFKISVAAQYPEVEHPVLEGREGVQISATECTTIWHLAYIPNLWEIKKRYEQHKEKSNIHTPEFLDSWYKAHLFGQYPRRDLRPDQIPPIILNKFSINPDTIYFANRIIELKHALMVKQWNNHFKPKTVLDLGCGRGVYMYFWEDYVDRVDGIELSEYAVNNSFTKNIRLGSISDSKAYEGLSTNYDLITAIDVLEHLDDDELNKTLEIISSKGQKFLFSIPVIGDPNLYNDKTHKQFRTKEEWIELIESHGIKVKEALSDWFFKEQLFIGEKQ